MNGIKKRKFQRVSIFALALCLAVSACAGCTAFAAGEEALTDGEPAVDLAPAPFPDVERHWGRTAVAYCVDRGYLNGVSAEAFAPNATVTRAQVVQALYNMAGSPDTEGLESPFQDIAGHWGEKAVIWAYHAGIVNGIGARSFAPNAAVIREQAAAMFQSYREYSLGEPMDLDGSYLDSFTDRILISSWAKDAVNWAVQAGVMSGTGKDTLSPKGTVTRAQLAQFIRNYYEPSQPRQPEAPESPAPDQGVSGGSSLGGTLDTPRNSPLVSYTQLSPNHSGQRTHRIDTITIHCMAEDWTVEQCGESFADPGRQASSNYGIGSDGRIALYVDEWNRSWCSSSGENDNRAVTIEVANIGGGPLWPVSQQAYSALIDLVTDICRRNGIERLLWQGDKSLVGQVDKQNMTVHRWFANKSCPGEYLYSRHGEIAEAVNRRLLNTNVANAIFKAAGLYRRS